MINKIPLLAIERLMKDKGCSRTSDGARQEMRKILESYLYEISHKASQIATHSSRKTINDGDLLIARI